MTLMVFESDLRLKSAAANVSAVTETLSYTIGTCALGKILVARSAKGICAILIGDDIHALKVDLGSRFPQARLVLDEATVRDDMAKVIHFADKPADGLNLTLDMRGTPFQRRVWEKLRAIPVGRTVTYAELARWVSPLASPRAVGAACAANPIALAVPCHRVVRSNGDLAGYRWGIERKRALIRKEAMA